MRALMGSCDMACRKDEIAEVREKNDPITVAAHKLIAAGIVTEEQVKVCVVMM